MAIAEAKGSVGLAEPIVLAIGHSPEFDDSIRSQTEDLVTQGVGRVVHHLVITPETAESIGAHYRQVADLQALARDKCSPTEVLFTFEPSAGQTYNGNAAPSSPLRSQDMPAVNEGVRSILTDTYQRVAEQEPRILAVSSGMAWLLAEKVFSYRAAEAGDGDIARGLAMQIGSGVTAAADALADPAANPFSDAHHGNHLYLPSLLAAGTRDAEAVQPTKMMDRRLARIAVEREFIRWYDTEDGNPYNHSDSPHTLGNPRSLTSDPFEGRYLGERLLHVVQTECDGNLVVGLATMGLGLAEVVSVLSTETDSPLRFAYIKLTAEEWKGKEKMEGDFHLGDKGILIDDLLFHGETKRDAIQIYREYGFEQPMDDIVCLVDRQLQHRGNFEGRSLADDGYRVHSLINMGSLIGYQDEKGLLTPERLQYVIEDYRSKDRHDMPAFALDGSQS